MKKNFKFMLVALLAVFGFGVTMAVVSTHDGQNVIEYGNYVYKVTKMPTANTNGEVTMMAIAEGQQEAISDANGNLDFPGHFTYQDGSKTYEFNVTKMESSVFHDVNYSVKHAVIPKELTEIPTAAFNTLTNLYDLTFEAGSQVTKIGEQAFASTQITSFDFSPCVKLEGLMDGVFVQKKNPGQTTENVNANITTITLPTSTAFKHINGAFRNLTALTTINHLEDSWIRELVDGAFSGCKKLTTLSLPGNDLLYISSKALEGSAIEDLSINVGNGVTNGNPMKLLGGCTVAYFWDPVNEEYVYNYEDKYATSLAAANTWITQYNSDNQLTPDDADYMQPIVENAWAPADANWNIYGNTAAQFAATSPTIAPLKKLTIAGTLKGKICKNVFAWCSKIKSNDQVTDFVVDELEFGTKGQIQEFAFLNCTGIEKLTLNDLGDNRLAVSADEYTIGHNAFWGCPIATLTLGDINTANAIGSAAFGTSLKTVTIGSVKAADAAFYDKATTTVADANAALGKNEKLDNATHKLASFVWADIDGATLSLAAPSGSLSNDTPDGDANIVPTLTFDMSNIDIYATPKLNPTIEIGEIASEGGVFATGAFNGVAIEKITFKGDIATDGLENAILAEVSTTAYTYTYEPSATEKKVYTTAEKNAEIAAGDAVVDQFEQAEEEKWYKKTSASSDSYVMADETYEQVDAAEVATEEPYGRGKYVKVGNIYKKVADYEEAGTTYSTNLKELVFEQKIKSSGIGEGAFNNLVKLEKITFGGLMSKEAVEAGAFTNTGKVNEGLTGANKKFNGFIGTEEKPFVVYTADLTDNDASENPFATGAFGPEFVENSDPAERTPRIIYWSISDEKLSAAILAAIQKDVLDNDGDDETVYDGEVVNPKFNVYKWVAYLVDVTKLHGFVVYPDSRAIALDQNINKKMAWGRYHLGSFNDGTYIVENDDPQFVAGAQEGPDADNLYPATDMIITRWQNNADNELQAIGLTTKNKYNVKVTLYGVYYDEDPFGKRSSVYMVPLQVIDGQYQIPEDNHHLIIVKVENQDGEFDEADKQVLINYDAPEPAPVDATAGDDEEEFLSGNSVWAQLNAETMGQGPAVDDQQRVFEKAAFSWTNQELVDAVANEGGQQSINVASDGKLLKDLYAMLNPAANAGFDIKRFEIERNTQGSGAYIGKGWYYALLKNYYVPAQNAAQAARIIWLDDAEATAIFGVKDGKVSVNKFNNGAIYNVLGQKVSKSYRGIIIKDGQKTINK